MPQRPFSFDRALAQQVQADELIPRQHPTPPKFMTACDFRVQHMLKYPQLAEFHSLAEHLNAGLCEGDHEVISYVTQGIRVRLRNRWYTADNVVVRRSGPRVIQELKPRGEMDAADQEPLTQYFALHDFRFEVISNESVYERRIEAENWLEIVRRLVMARDLDTADAEFKLLEILDHHGPQTLGDLVDPGNRSGSFLQEIALYRLLHRGLLVSPTLTEHPLDADTGFVLCG